MMLWLAEEDSFVNMSDVRRMKSSTLPDGAQQVTLTYGDGTSEKFTGDSATRIYDWMHQRFGINAGPLMEDEEGN